jgi:hypothetical protein
VVIPRPKDGLDPPGVRNAYIRFLSTEGSAKAQHALQGRIFGDIKVAATFISESDFAAVSRVDELERVPLLGPLDAFLCSVVWHLAGRPVL